VLGFLQCVFQRGHVRIRVAMAFGLAQPDAVDNRGVIECIGDDRVFGVQQRFEQAAIGIEAGSIQNRIVLAMEVGNNALEFLVQILRAADKAHRGHTEAMLVQRGLGGFDDAGIIGQAKIVIGAEIQHIAGFIRLDLDALRGRDAALALVQPGLVNLGQLGVQAVVEMRLGHSVSL